MNAEELGKLMSESLVNGLKMGFILIIKQPVFWIIIALLIAYNIFKNKMKKNQLGRDLGRD